MRPAALIRGPSWNTILDDVQHERSTPARSRERGEADARRARTNRRSPSRIRIRFSPIIGTMSLAVETATRSR